MLCDHRIGLRPCLGGWSWLPGLLLMLPLACVSDFPRTMVDLTYEFDETTVYWPNSKPFRWQQTAWGPTASGYWYASADFSASEHGGTHIDAPIHFGQDRLTLDRIPLERLVGPGVVVDVRTKCAEQPDYAVQVEDLLQWEAVNGRMSDSAIVLLWTGWGARWPDRKRYLGSDTPDDAGTLHFPGLSVAAADFLVEQRHILGVGIDTASIDPGSVSNFPVHQRLNKADVYALENVAALDRVPARGTTIVALPMKIKGGTGGPVRIVALLP